jgi:hypothetical protein
VRVLSKKLVGSRSVVLAMALSSVLAIVGCASNNSSTGSNITATPSFSPGAGTYTVAKPVTVADATPGAVLYCTTDGSMPTTSSPQCSEPITVFQSEFLQAIAVAPGKSASAVASAGYTINLNPAAAPTFNPAGGSFTGPQMVTISDSISGANIYYTLDGSSPLNGNVPSATATLFTGPVSITQNTILNAVAVAAGSAASPIASAAYTIQTVLPAPTVSGIAPASANAGDPAVTLTVNGTNFVSGATVLWNGVALTTTYVSATQLTAAVTANLIASAGTANVTVAQLSGFSGALVFTINSVTPAITALSPATGPSPGGTSVTITGTNFTNATAVNFGTTPATSFTVVSPTSITAVSPVGSGTVNVTVVAPSGSSATATADQFVYIANPPTVTGISPATGPAAGGTSVTITGTNFTSASTVNFGSTPATNVTVVSATSITAVSPAGAGAVDITVVTPGGPSATSSADQFLYGPVMLSGIVVSGGTPITGATVQLYVAGTSGYGTGSSELTMVPTTITTGSTGNFTLQYACPTSGAPSDQIYLVATGGNSGGGVNKSIALMAALGTCSKAPASATINEVTTIASAYALSAFATINTSGTGITVGAPATASSCTAANNWQSQQANTCNYNGLVHAFQAVNNLVDISTGTALLSTPAYLGVDLAHDPNIVNNSTVPQTRINALADMLAFCVESSGSGCSGGTNLFGLAATGSVTPADTLQAALNIAQNPGNGVSNLLGLVASMTTPPYSVTSADTGTLILKGTGAPTDLTLALTFTGAGLGIAPGITLSDGNFGILNEGLGIDAAGNIWVGADLNNPFNGGPDGLMIAGFNPLGAPITNSTSLSAASPPVPNYGGYNPDSSQNGKFDAGLNSLAIDSLGNLWTNDTNAFKGTETSISSLPPTSSNLFPLIGSAGFFAFDLTGNLWYADNGSVNEYQASGSGIQGFPFANGGPNYIVFDSNGGLWAAGSNPASGPDVFQISTTDGSVVYDAFPTNAPAVGGLSGYITTLAADGNGNVYGCDETGTMLNVFNSTAKTAPANLLVTSYQIPTQRACGTQLVLDGQGHLFSVLMNSFGVEVNYNFNFNSIGNIDEYTTGGTLISPLANGYTGSSSGEAPTVSPDFNLSNPLPGIGAAIDGSGNLWVLNNDTSGTVPVSFNTVTTNVLVEYIGIGAPVVTPIAAAVANGLQGVRP